MTRIILVTCIMALAAACTGPTGDGSRVRDSSTRVAPEPSTPGVHISGYARFGVSTVN